MTSEAVEHWTFPYLILGLTRNLVYSTVKRFFAELPEGKQYTVDDRWKKCDENGREEKK